MAMTGGMSKTRCYFLQLAVKTICLIGIFAAYGLLQERILKGHYENADGTSKDNFHSAPLLVFCNRLTSLAAGLMLAQLQFAAERPTLLPSATSISPQPETWAQRISALVARIRPASPFLSYAIVAGLNNAATVSQYASLSYLSFTTSTLAKSAKMVPVLIIGHTLYRKRYKPRQWIGAAIVILGIWGYLASFPKVAINEEEQGKVIATNWIGVLCLFSYLFFDGLTSTMQERLFVQAKVREETFTLVGITGGIIDQMVTLSAPLIARMLIIYLDMGQSILLYDCVQHAASQLLRINDALYYTRIGIPNSAAPYSDAQRYLDCRTACLVPRDSNLWCSHCQSHHDNQAVRQYNM